MRKSNCAGLAASSTSAPPQMPRARAPCRKPRTPAITSNTTLSPSSLDGGPRSVHRPSIPARTPARSGPRGAGCQPGQGEAFGPMTVHSQFKNPNRMDINDQPIAQRLIGKHVIVRSRNEGINFGKLEAADETGCVITDARRIWYHKPADSKMAWYEGVALSGLHRSSK